MTMMWGDGGGMGGMGGMGGAGGVGGVGVPGLTRDARNFGGVRSISCDGGGAATCPGGTRDCYDNSPAYCKRPGGLVEISCGGGQRRQWKTSCPGGTQECHDDSTLYCSGGGISGGSEEHTCRNGLKFDCPGGTRDCRDNSPTYCQPLPPPLPPPLPGAVKRCEPQSVGICGSSGVFVGLDEILNM